MNKLQINPDSQSLNLDKKELSFAPEIGRGGVKRLTFNSGIRLSISNYKFNSNTQIEYHSFPPVFGFGFCLSGDIHSQMASFNDSRDIRSGQSALFHIGGDKMIETIGTRRVIRLDIIFEPEKLQSLLRDNLAERIPDLHRIISNPQRIFDALTPNMRDTIVKILDCPYQGLIRDLYLESKVLELVAYKLDQLTGIENRWSGRVGLKDEDVDKTRHASKLITRNLENPPDFTELAKQVGMCRRKLHHCFHEVYGMTPFDYLRYKRIETAETLLRRGELNVTQTAYTVGYSSLSHFSKAFRQQTGYLPGKYMRENRNR